MLDNPGATTDVGGLLPSQYDDTVRSTTPAELQLMAAVLETAIDDFRRYAQHASPLGRQLFERASRWIAASDLGWPYSFENICRALDIDPFALRRTLMRERTARAAAARSLARRTIDLTSSAAGPRTTWAVRERPARRGAGTRQVA
jgi:hypothetical protein